MKNRTALNRIFLVITLLVTLSCNFIGSLGREEATPTARSLRTTASPTSEPYPPLPAPKLLSRTPEPYEPQALDAPVELVFDQPMDRQSVARAFTIEPRIAGELTWDDARTLRFTPTEAFSRGAGYAVTVGENARNAEGTQLLEPVSFNFQTIGFLEVAEVQPAQGSEDIDPDTTVTVVFNRPVVPLTSVAQQGDLPDPLTFDPPVEGKGEWLNTAVYRFLPAQGFAPATAYEATIAAGLKDTLGFEMEADYTWGFSTVGPMVTAWSPRSNAQYIGPSDVISITFNQPMDHTSAETALSLQIDGRDVTGSYRWMGGTGPTDSETLLFKPDQPFPRNAMVSANLQASARARGSRVTLANDLTWQFWTVRDPGIVNVTPDDGERDVEPLSDVEITFAGPMQTGVLLDHLTIVPKPTEVYTYWHEADTMLRLAFPKEPATAYRLTLDADAPDAYGAPLGTAFTLRFTTGDLSPYASLSTLGTIGTFDAYTDTVVYVRHRNVTRLDVSLFRLPLDTFMQLHGYGSYDYRNAFSPSPANLIRQWSVPLNAGRNVAYLRALDMVDAEGAQLPPGIYYLQLTAPEVLERNPDAAPATFTIVRSRVNLVVKQASSETLVWATDLRTGAPLNDLAMRFYHGGRLQAGAGSTDENGLWIAQGLTGTDLWADYFTVSGDPGDANFAVAFNDWDNGIRPWNFNLNSDYGASPYVSYLYTDRPIYRPGQTVYFKGILRRDDDADYTIPQDVGMLDVSVSDPQGKELYSASLPVSEMGTFYDELTLGAEAPLGTYFLQMQGRPPGTSNQDFYAGTSFRVAEYRQPEFEVSVETDRPGYLSGDLINVTVQASYYFGGAVANATLDWNVLSAPHDFAYDCPTGRTCPGYSWTDYEYGQDYGEVYGSYGRLIANGSTTTDAQGHATFRVSADIAEEINSRSFTIEANVTDINDQVVSQRTTTVVHKGNFYVGLAPEQRVAQAGEAQTVDILTVDWESAPVANVALEVVAMEHRWYSVRQEADDGNAYWTWTTEDVPVYTTTARTDAAGRATISFTPETSGSYRVRATGKDTRGNVIRSSTYLWVWGGGEAAWRRESTSRIDLIADRDLYQVGDVAEILIPSPYSGTVQALITIERGHILETEVRELQSTTEVLRIPIEESYVPNVFVSVVLLQGSEQASDRLASFRMGEVVLPVSTESKQLHITLTPDRDMTQGETYRPRETAVYDVQVTDSAGNPVEAELSLRLADLAVLALANETEPTLTERFWSERGLSVRTSTPLAIAMEAYNRDLAPGAKGGGGGGESDTGLIRTRFADTAYWAAVIRTDAAGHARVEVALPDNLTTWRMQARGITAETLVGRSEVDIRTTLDVLVRPVLPRFFVVGDQAEIATIVNNNTAADVSADVSISVEGLAVDGATVQTIAVPAGGEAKVVWPVTVLQGEQVTVRMEARAGSLFDGREDALPVYAYATPEVVATAGRLSEAGLRQEVVQLPHEFDPSQGELTVQVNGSLTGATADALDYLKYYPYECVEQTVSRFLPNVMTFQALSEMGLSRPDLELDLRQQVGLALQRLYNERHYDGGWGWWVTDESDPYLTTYALQGLLEAYRAGFTVDTGVMSDAAAYLRDNLVSVTRNSSHWQVNRLAYQLYVLSEYTNLVPGAEAAGELGRAVNLYGQRDQLDRYGQALLAVALALLEPGQQSRVDTLLSDLAGDAVLSATGTHWEEAEPDYWNMNTDVRTTAMVLWALARQNPGSELLPNVVRWLMEVRQAGYWESTNTTSWSLMALVAYMRATGELQGQFSYTVSLNGEPLLTGDVNADTIRRENSGDETQRAQVAVAQLFADQANRLIIERLPPSGEQSGAGQLYYTAQLRTFVPVQDVQALDRGIIVARQYSLVEQPDTGVSQAAVGDTIRVKLTIVAPTDLYYVTVEDPLPAGCEAVDVTLNTTSVVGEAPTVRNLTAEQEDSWYRWYGWGWWWFSHAEMRDEKVTLFSTYLPRGTYEYSYVMRASVPGVYNVLPATASEMYFPDVFGRSEGGQFTVAGE